MFKKLLALCILLCLLHSLRLSADWSSEFLMGERWVYVAESQEHILLLRGKSYILNLRYHLPYDLPFAIGVSLMEMGLPTGAYTHPVDAAELSEVTFDIVLKLPLTSRLGLFASYHHMINSEYKVIYHELDQENIHSVVSGSQYCVGLKVKMLPIMSMMLQYQRALEKALDIHDVAYPLNSHGVSMGMELLFLTDFF